MKFLEKMSKHSSIYLLVQWGKEGEYGLANILLVLMEMDPKI